MHTPTHRQMEMHAPKKKKRLVSHSCSLRANKAASKKCAGGCRGRRLELVDKCPLLLSSSNEQVIDQSTDGAGAPNRYTSTE